MVYAYNGVLFTHRKEWVNTSYTLISHRIENVNKDSHIKRCYYTLGVTPQDPYVEILTSSTSESTETGLLKSEFR